jgi:hypothetical protein
MATKELWVVDVSAKSARPVYVKEGEHLLYQLEEVGFDSAASAPCYLSYEYYCEGKYETKKSTGTAILHRCAADDGRPTEVARLTSAPGWDLSHAKIHPDGRGMAAVANNGVWVRQDGVDREAAILWTHNGRSGRLELPRGYWASVLAWSRDGRRLAVSCERWDEGGADMKIAVYEFNG